MPEEATTARILHEGVQGETVTVLSSRQGLVILVQDNLSGHTVPIRWESVLDILPSVRGKVVWENEEIGDFPGVSCPVCFMANDDSSGVESIKFKGEPNNAPGSLSEILTSTNPISSYILHLLDHLGVLLLPGVVDGL